MICWLREKAEKCIHFCRHMSGSWYMITVWRSIHTHRELNGSGSRNQSRHMDRHVFCAYSFYIVSETACFGALLTLSIGLDYISSIISPIHLPFLLLSHDFFQFLTSVIFKLQPNIISSLQHSSPPPRFLRLLMLLYGFCPYSKMDSSLAEMHLPPPRSPWVPINWSSA